MRLPGALAIGAALALGAAIAVLPLGGCRGGRCEWRGVARTAAQRDATIRSRPG